MNKQSLLFAILLLFSFQNLFAQARYLEPVFDQVTVTKNVIYGQNIAYITQQGIPGLPVSTPLVLDFYEPAGDTSTARPLVLVFPGGFYLPSTNNGFCNGSRTDLSVVETCTRLAKIGYTAAAVDYRWSWNPGSSDIQVRTWTFVHAMYRGIQDARTAVRFFKKSTVEDGNPFRVDTSRIVMWGDAVGGQIALGAAYANDTTDWDHPDLKVVLQQPFGATSIINPIADGNIWGTDFGIVPPDYPTAFAQPGDTLSIPNWPAYSSDFQLCVSMAGYIPDVPWISPGEIPAILYHAPDDPLQPCLGNATAATPFVGLPYLTVAGSCALAEQLEISGNNQIFKDADFSDCISTNALVLSGGLEGFYPFNGQFLPLGRPWHWVSSCPNNPNAPTDGDFARLYLDTMVAYFAPRACAALGLCNASSQNPGSLCQPSVVGKVYVDLTNDGFTADDLPFPGVVLELQPGNRHAVSNVVGNYIISAPPGDYTLIVPNPPTYYASNGTPLTVIIPTAGDTVQNVSLTVNGNFNDLLVTLTPLTDPRPGFTNQFDVRWKNIGTTQLSGTVTLEVDANYLIEDNDLQAVVDGNKVTWTFNNLSPLQEGEGWVLLKLPPSVPLGWTLSSGVVGELTGGDDASPSDNTESIREIVIGSYDPNDKRASLEGDVTETMLTEAQNWINYTVRFQNTGTASAINVYITDTISELLNINTLEVLGTSHPMRWEINGQGTVTWFFDNINLPDSFSNEPASHGYVRFRIKPKFVFPELLNLTVHNFADIYFDFNAPVRTNTTETKFVLPVSTNLPAEKEFVQISPNPACERVTISCPTTSAEAELSIFDISGKTVFTRRVAVAGGNLKITVSVNDFPKGTYIVKVSGGGETRAGRFVRE